MGKLILIFCFISTAAFAKEVEIDTFLVKKEAEINSQLEKLRATTNDNEREVENESLIESIESILSYPGIMDYPFESFRTMSTISSPDGAFRIFNWNTESDAGLNNHFCYVVVPNRGDKPNTVYKFNEDRVTIPPKPENTLMPEHWYGALYYNIIPVNKGNKTFYTIIGYNGGSTSTNKKLIDVFYFKGKNLRLGYPLFQESPASNRLARRVFFEYAEKTTIAVNMNVGMDAIVFDHLAPETPNLVGMYDYYVPDMTYDAYRWNGTIWEYEEDLVAVNKENRKTRIYKPTDADESEDFIEVKDVWVSPVDNSGPVGVSGGNPIAPVNDAVVTDKKGRKSKTKQHRRLFNKKAKKPRSAVTVK